MAAVTRWTADRLLAKVTAAADAASDGRLAELVDREVQPVADTISRRIAASGRGGAHNSEFANVETRTWIAGSGRLNVLVGWLNPPDHAHERGSGGKLWYQYQDSGFTMFPNTMARSIPGVLANIDRRENTIDAVDRVLNIFVSDIAKELRR